MNTLKLNDGRQLAYELYGDENGKPIFFLDGLGGSRLTRHPNNQLTIEAGIKLITLDRPGYGGSTPLADLKLLDWPDDLAKLADKLGIAKFTVAGYSGGAPFALATAHELSNRVLKVLLISPVGSLETHGALKTVHNDFKWLWRLRWFKPFLRMAGRDEAKRVKNDIVKYTDNWLKEAPTLDKELFTDTALRQMLEKTMSEAFRQGAHGWLADVFALLKWGFELKDIHTPVEIFHGGADEIIFPQMAQIITENLPNAQLKIFPDEGHFCLFRHWVEILKRVN